MQRRRTRLVSSIGGWRFVQFHFAVARSTAASPLVMMACGCPVACSNAASLPQVCGDAARYFSPRDAVEMAAAVAEVLDDPGPWAERGLARAAGFTWERAAKQHEDVYRELLGVA